MRTWFQLVLAACLLAGCVDSQPPPVPKPQPVDSASAGPANTPDGSVSEALPSEAELRKVLLSEADLPGFTAQPPSAGDGAGTDVRGCRPASGDESAAPSRSVSVLLSQSALGPFASEQLTASSADASRRILADLKSIVTDCPQYTTTQGSLTMDMVLAPLTFKRYGEESTAFTMTAIARGQPLRTHAHVVIVRCRGLIITVTAIAALQQPQISLTEKAVAAAVGKASRWC